MDPAGPIAGRCFLDNACLIGEGRFVISWEEFESVSFQNTPNRIGNTITVQGTTGGRAPKDSFVSIQSDKATNFSIGNAEIKKGLYLYKEPFYLHNVGHVLGDDIFGIFQALYYWNFHVIPSNEITLVMPERFKNEIEKRQILADHFKIITLNQILYVPPDLNNPICFEKVLVGWNGFGYVSGSHEWVPNPVVEAFRTRALQVFQVPDNALTRTRNDFQNAAVICDVLIIVKDMSIADHKATLGNPQELANSLKSELGCQVEIITWTGKTLQEQLVLIHTKRIVVSLPGSDLMSCIFMPTVSGFLVPDRKLGDHFEGSHELNIWFGKMPYRRVFIYRTQLDTENNFVWKDGNLTWNPTHFVSEVRDMINTLRQDLTTSRDTS